MTALMTAMTPTTVAAPAAALLLLATPAVHGNDNGLAQTPPMGFTTGVPIVAFRGRIVNFR